MALDSEFTHWNFDRMKRALMAIETISEMQSADHWTHAQRNRMNYTIQALAAYGTRDTVKAYQKDTVGDIPF